MECACDKTVPCTLASATPLLRTAEGMEDVYRQGKGGSTGECRCVKCDGMPGAMRLSRGLSVIAGEWCPSSIGQLLPATIKKKVWPPPFKT